MSEISKKIGEKIKTLREHHNFSQHKLSKMVGISRSSISQMESGERKTSAEELLKLSGIFKVSVENLLNLEKPPEVILIEEKKVMKKRSEIRINVPQKNVEKFKEVLIYILNKIGSKPNIGETAIYKLLYFIDFNYYERYEEQLIGATYMKNRFGPTPIEFKKITERMIEDKDIEKVDSTYFDFPQTKYLPLRRANLSKLKADEIDTIEDVLNKLSDMNALQISEYSHNDIPWLTTEDGDIINYESVFYRTLSYSVRDYSEPL